MRKSKIKVVIEIDGHKEWMIHSVLPSDFIRDIKDKQGDKVITEDLLKEFFKLILCFDEK